MAKILIFGTADLASLAHFYLKHDSPHEVVAFVLTREYIKEPTFEGKPVIAFEEVERHYSPSDHKFIAPMTAKKMNRVRQQIYDAIKAKGYSCISYVSSKATVFPGHEIGDNCFILEDNTIQPFTKIGNNVVMWSGNHIGHHSTIKDHVFITSHVVISGHCVIEPFAFFGVNATVRDAITIAPATLVGMGAVISSNTEEGGVYTTKPAMLRTKKSHEIEFL